MNTAAAYAYYREHRDAFPEPFRLRIHRAFSWLKHAEMLASDYHAVLSSKLQGNARGSAHFTPDIEHGLNKTGADWDFAFVSL